MKNKILNILLLLTSLAGYLEWGKNKKLFLFQIEAEIISKLFSNPVSVIHPLTSLPLLGQLLLIITLFQKIPGKVLTYSGIVSIGVLYIMMFVVGLLNLNFKILVSTLPFFILSYLVIKNQLKMKGKSNKTLTGKSSDNPK